MAALRVLVVAALFAAQPARGAEPYVVDGDAISLSLTGKPGDPAAGRAIVGDRRRGLCLLCHSGPFPEERFQGNLAPDLAGAGDRLDEGQLRLRIVASRRLNPDTIMPSYGKSSGFALPAAAFAGKPILTPQEIEDVVAFLKTLRVGAPK